MKHKKEEIANVGSIVNSASVRAQNALHDKRFAMGYF